MGGRMGGIALALATLVEDREDMVVPFACLHACFVWNAFIRRVLLPVPIYTFSIRKESCVSFIFFFLPFLYTCCDVSDGGKEGRECT